MPQVIFDRPVYSLTEDRGTVRGLTRQGRVVFNRAVEGEYFNDYLIMEETLRALDRDGYRQFAGLGATGLTAAEAFRFSNSRFKNIVLVKRALALSDAGRSGDGDRTLVDVTLTYEHVLDGPNQWLLNPPAGVIFGRHKTSIVDKSTNFFYRNGVRDDNAVDEAGRATGGRTLITVAHVFPKSDNQVAGMLFRPDLPRTIIQGGEINIPFPQANFSVQGMIQTTDILEFAVNLIGSISSGPMLGRDAKTWLCSEVQYELSDYGTDVALDPVDYALGRRRTYKVSLEFQYNFDTWEPTVAFHDQRTGRPPANVQQGYLPGSTPGVYNMMYHPDYDKDTNPLPKIPAGMWQVPALTERNFEEYLGATFESIEEEP